MASAIRPYSLESLWNIDVMRRGLCITCHRQSVLDFVDRQIDHAYRRMTGNPAPHRPRGPCRCYGPIMKVPCVCMDRQCVLDRIYDREDVVTHAWAVDGGVNGSRITGPPRMIPWSMNVFRNLFAWQSAILTIAYFRANRGHPFALLAFNAGCRGTLRGLLGWDEFVRIDAALIRYIKFQSDAFQTSRFFHRMVKQVAGVKRPHDASPLVGGGGGAAAAMPLDPMVDEDPA